MNNWLVIIGVLAVISGSITVYYSVDEGEHGIANGGWGRVQVESALCVRMSYMPKHDFNTMSRYHRPVHEAGNERGSRLSNASDSILHIEWLYRGNRTS